MHPDLAQSTAQALVHCPVSFSIEVGFETRCSADTDIENLAKHISHAHLDHSDRSVDPAFWNDHESLEAGTDAILRDVFHYSDIYPGDSCVDPVLWTNTAGDVTSDTSGSMDTFDRYPATDKPIPDSSNILDVGIRNTILGPAIDEDVPMNTSDTVFFRCKCTHSDFIKTPSKYQETPQNSAPDSHREQHKWR